MAGSLEKKKRNPAHWLCMGSLLILVLQLPATAATGAVSGENPPASDERQQQNTAAAKTKQLEAESVLDRHKQFMDTQVQRAAQWVDGFFVNSNYEAESAQSQFRLRPEFYYRDEQGAELNMKVRARLELPNLGHRISLVAGADENGDPADQFANDSDQNTIAGLQFLLSDSKNWHTSVVAGARFGDFAFFLGPRFRYQTNLNDRTLARFTQTFRWLTDNQWDIGSKADLYYVINDQLYFRQTLYGRWRDEEHDREGLRTQVSSVLSHRLSATSGLQYDFTTVLHTEPDAHVDKFTLSLRYRRRTVRDWLYYEVAPQVSFEDEFGFRTNPGIRLRLELYYGESGSGHFWEHDSRASAE